MEELVKRYRQVAVRFGERFGPPPPMPVDQAELATVIAQMVGSLNGRRSPEAGPAVKVGDNLTVQIEASGRVFEVTADVCLQDAEGNLAGTMRVDVGDACGKALVDDLVTHLRGVAISRLEGLRVSGHP